LEYAHTPTRIAATIAKVFIFILYPLIEANSPSL
jgi:hypothetical protein